MNRGLLWLVVPGRFGRTLNPQGPLSLAVFKFGKCSSSQSPEVWRVHACWVFMILLSAVIVSVPSLSVQLVSKCVCNPSVLEKRIGILTPCVQI